LHEDLDRCSAPPQIALWISDNFEFEAIAVCELGLRDAEDIEIFNSARDENAIVLTKDRDFLDLLGRFGPPPKVIWLTCGNTSNEVLEHILRKTLSDAVELLTRGEAIVEISSVPVLEP
jgi:predicted nuclease of predicted toxin-antitoxin system